MKYFFLPKLEFGTITHEDQERDGLQFECRSVANGFIVIVKEPTEGASNNWAKRVEAVEKTEIEANDSINKAFKEGINQEIALLNERITFLNSLK